MKEECVEPRFTSYYGMNDQKWNRLAEEYRAFDDAASKVKRYDGDETDCHEICVLCLKVYQEPIEKDASVT